MSVSRRALIGGLGGLAAGGVLGSGVARGAAPTARRIVLYVTSHGTVHDRWEMPGNAPRDRLVDRSLAGLSEAEFSPILAPLWAFRDRLLVIDGLTNYGGLAAAFNEHEEGQASCLTGTLPIPVDGSIGIAGGPSIDQIIAATRSTPIRSLEYAIGGWSVNFDDNGQPLPYEGEIGSAYQRLFPDGTTDPDGVPTTADRIRAHQDKVLARAQGRYDGLARRLSGDDRARLEQHRDLLADLSAQLAGLADLDCEIPSQPGGFPSWYDPTWSEEMTLAFFGLVQAAFTCGITDVITVRGDSLRNETIGAPPGDLHNDYAHNVNNDPASADVMVEYHKWHAERFADLCELLDAVPEGDGTMLDATLCVWTNELSTGDHQFTRHPVVIAGGTDALESGRYVSFPPERDFAGPWGDIEGTGPAHNQLLAVLANAMGLQTESIGDPSFQDYDGATIDATGVLPGLLR